jgi:NADH-quinone oxidoreductase subunit N
MHDLLPSLHGQLDDVISSIRFFIPEIYLSALFVIVLVTDLLFGRSSGWLCRVVSIAGLVYVLLKSIGQAQFVAGDKGMLFFSNMLLLNHTTLILKLLIDVIAIIILLFYEWDDSLESHAKKLSDLYSISVAAILGLHLMVMAANLLSIYLSVEMVSIASYLMVSYKTENRWGSEAGLKYVLFGAACSAIMLYGISLLYGLCGTLDLFSGALTYGLTHASPLTASFALILLLVGIGFKLSFVPMHFWAPDIYQGAPTPVSAFLSALPKIAAFGLLINFLSPFTDPGIKWNAFDFQLFISIVAIATMVAGNFAAALQNNVKRMLAYSSIGHTGFAMMALVNFSLQGQGIGALKFYLLAYAFAGTAAWMLATYFADVAGAEDMTGYKGLGFKYPLAGVCFIIILISLTGIPLTAGFNGKLLAFSAVYSVYRDNHNIWMLLLMITGAITTVVSLFYYIKIPLNLFLRKTDRTTGFAASNRVLLTCIAIITILIVYLGVFPDFIYKYL